MSGNQERLHLTESEFWTRYGHRESTSLDFKAALPRARKLQDLLVAFSNTRGGDVVIGVDEGRPRRVVGTTWTQEDEETVQDAARDTRPPVAVEPRSVLVDEHLVVVIPVKPVPSGWVQTSDGRLLVRAGPTNRALWGEDLGRFVRERVTEPVEDVPVPGVGLEDLRSESLGEYVGERLGKSRPDREDLRKLGLLTPDGRVRLATLLLFGQEPQRDNRRFGITVVRYEGSFESSATFRERRDLTGPLAELVLQADRMIYEEMRKSAVVSGLIREEVPEYPPVAMREALVNAVGHRDYSLRGATVEVRLFDDAIEIESPGGLAGFVTIDNIRHVQYSRNERLMEVLLRLRLAEEAGTGMDKIFTSMEDALLEKPHLEERSTSFLVRLLGRSVFAAEDRLWVTRFSSQNLSPDARVALVYARRQGAISNRDLRDLRSLDDRSSRGVLQELVTRGLLEPVGRARGTRYVLTTRAVASAPAPSLDDQLSATLAHASRVGSIANRDVRGLLGVDREQALRLLEELVMRGALVPQGERRARRYYPSA